MKPYKHQKNNKKKITILILVIILIIAGVFSYLFFTGKIFDHQHTDSLKSIDANKDGSKGATTVPGTTPSQDSNKTIIPTDNNSSPQTNIEKPLITRAEQSGANVRVSAIFSKPAYGDCLLTIEKVGQTTLSQTAQVVVGPSYYACDGFVINVNSFPSKGDWTVTVVHRYNKESVASDPSTLTIQ